jgi:two-component system, response regulator
VTELPSCILLVEDNPDDVELTKRALRRNKIANDLHVVTDGAQALDFLFSRGEWEGRSAEDDPCLVLLDIKLPKVNGLQVLQEVRAHDRLRMTPVVMLTSSDEEQDLIESYNLGANSYIRKPVDFDQFLSAVQQLGMYWLVLNQTPPRIS